MRFQIVILICLLSLRQFSSESDEEQELGEEERLEEERLEEEHQEEDHQNRDEKQEEHREEKEDVDRPGGPPEHPLEDKSSLQEVDKPAEVYNSDSFSFQRFNGPVGGVAEEVKVSNSDPRVSQEVDYVSRPDYSYAYGVHDKKSGNSHTHAQSRDGDAVTGEYRVLQPDGLVRIVKYTADATSGFRVVIEYAKMKEPIN